MIEIQMEDMQQIGFKRMDGEDFTLIIEKSDDNFKVMINTPLKQHIIIEEFDYA